jgi:nucleotide-binding universal stress UspA family protein
MYKRILVPLDGSKLSESVLPYARFVANRLQLPIDLLHVNDAENGMGSYAKGTDYLTQVAAGLSNSVVDCFIEDGKAAEVIVDRASRDPGILITMATHGRSGAQRWLLGSVAQKVLQATSSPLLLIRSKKETRSSDEARIRSVIVPLDGSHLAESIFPHVLYLAKHLNLEVVLIRSYIVPTTGYFVGTGVLPPAIGELANKIKKETTEYLQARMEQLQAEGIDRVTCLALEGGGAEEIIDLAQKTSDNIVAMSTHGRSGMGRWVLGSVTDRVVCYCGDPVLVIRPLDRSSG